MSRMRWIGEITSAEREARASGKLVLLFFQSQGCGGCRKTETITFADPGVAELIERTAVPVSIRVTENQGLSASHRVEWTPTFVLTDGDGAELERWVGFLPPEDFVPQFYLAMGLAAFHRKMFKEAEGAFEWIIDNRPDAVVAPEARYYMGVTLYKDTGDASHLKRTWEAMNRRYPGDFWTKKASAWS
ncbi:MAG: thioredoxin fold domain-containing protein [Deltaproteobacteria bacterium]|nr:thioredoxin fold domain-containing protein [Deltaproteobacteria bacterium]